MHEAVEVSEHMGTEFPGGNNRAPIYVHLADRDKGDFIVLNNRLIRGNEASPSKQAELLREWARVPKPRTIAVGDYNMDNDFHTTKGNPAFDIIEKDGHGKWIESKKLIDTNWADSDGDPQCSSLRYFGSSTKA